MVKIDGSAVAVDDGYAPTYYDDRSVAAQALDPAPYGEALSAFLLTGESVEPWKASGWWPPRRRRSRRSRSQSVRDDYPVASPVFRRVERRVGEAQRRFAGGRSAVWSKQVAVGVHLREVVDDLLCDACASSYKTWDG